MKIVLYFRYIYIALAGHPPEIVRTELDGASPTTLSVSISDPLGLAIKDDILTIADRRYENGTVETWLVKFNTVTEQVVETIITNKVSKVHDDLE